VGQLGEATCWRQTPQDEHPHKGMEHRLPSPMRAAPREISEGGVQNAGNSEGGYGRLARVLPE